MALLKDRAQLRACGQEPALVQKRDGLADRSGMPEQSAVRSIDDDVIRHAVEPGASNRNLAIVRPRQDQE